MNVFELFAKVNLDTKGYESGLMDSEEKTKTFGTKLKTALAVGTAAFTALTSGVAAFSKKVVDAAGEVAAYGDNIDKMSQKMGISAEAYQEWDAVMQHSGTSMESLKMSMKTLANAVESGNEAFSRIGITQEQIASMNNEDLFAATITGLQNISNETERTYLAGQLLGRGATELGALLNTSAEDTQALKDRVHELGGVMSDEAVKAAAAYQDQLQDLTTAFGSIKREALSSLLPGLTMVMSGITDLISGTGDGSSIAEGASAIVEQAINIFTKVADAAPVIIETLVTAITDNLDPLIQAAITLLLALIEGIAIAAPILLGAVPDIIGALVNGLIGALPQLMEVGGQLIAGLFQGIGLALAGLWDLIKGWATSIIDRFKAALGIHSPSVLMMNIGKDLILGLINGIAAMIQNVVAKVKSIASRIQNAFSDVIRRATSWGRDLIQNFINGIGQRVGRLVDKVKGIAQTVKDFLGFSEPKKGPLSNFHTYAPDMIQLFAEGLKQSEGILANQLNSSLGALPVASAPTASSRKEQLRQSDMVKAFRTAMDGMKVVLDDEQVGSFVDTTVSRALYNY